MNKHKHCNSSSLANWLIEKGQFNVFATVTMKQMIVLADGRSQFISREECSKTACVLRDRISKKIIGQVRFRHGERLDWATFIESGFGKKRMHLHLLIGKPDEITHNAFEKLFRDVSDRLDWIYKEIDIRQITDIEGNGLKAVANYCLKEGTDALDLQSSFLRHHQIG